MEIRRVNRPVPFAGTEEERRANFETHWWQQVEIGEVPRCANCDAKTWHAAASYPCGVEPPRETVELRAP